MEFSILQIAIFALLIVFICLWATKKTTTSSTCNPYVAYWYGSSSTLDGSFSTFSVPAASCGVTFVLPDDDLQTVNYFYYQSNNASSSNAYVTPTQPAQVRNYYYSNVDFNTISAIRFLSGSSFTVLFTEPLATAESVTFAYNND